MEGPGRHDAQGGGSVAVRCHYRVTTERARGRSGGWRDGECNIGGGQEEAEGAIGANCGVGVNYLSAGLI